ncbi:hypothetical protein QQP08_005684, partial [Theobroma cacao]
MLQVRPCFKDYLTWFSVESVCSTFRSELGSCVRYLFPGFWLTFASPKHVGVYWASQDSVLPKIIMQILRSPSVDRLQCFVRQYLQTDSFPLEMLLLPGK